jgi:hypothetical protein
MKKGIIKCVDTGILNGNFCSQNIEFDFFPEDRQKSLDSLKSRIITHYSNHLKDDGNKSSDSDFKINKDKIDDSFLEEMLKKDLASGTLKII